jgi:hypothetical protein
MNHNLLWSLLLLLVATSHSFVIEDHLGTHSPYQAPSIENETAVPTQCQVSPFFVWYLLRHGSRQPSKSDISKLAILESTLRDNAQTITADRFRWMRTWRSPFKVGDAGLLLRRGEQEHYNISRRLVRRFPSLLNDARHEMPSTSFPYQCSQVARTSVSAVSFGLGMFESSTSSLGNTDSAPFYVFSETEAMDYTLRFFELCPAYVEHVLLNSSFLQESVQWFGQHVKRLRDEVARTMGVPDNESHWLSAETLLAMYTTCGFEVTAFSEVKEENEKKESLKISFHSCFFSFATLTQQSTGFCSLFTPEHFEIFEYRQDLLTYWVRSYGSTKFAPVTAAQSAAPLVQALISEFEAKEDGVVPQKAKFRFGHAETVIPFLTALVSYCLCLCLFTFSPYSSHSLFFSLFLCVQGLFQDNFTLRWNSDSSDISRRRFRLSQLAPFATNVGFVFHNCSDGVRFRVLQNEREVALPACDGAMYCPWQRFKSTIGASLPRDLWNRLCFRESTLPTEEVVVDDSDDDSIARRLFLDEPARSIWVGICCFLLGAAVVSLIWRRRLKTLHGYQRLEPMS